MDDLHTYPLDTTPATWPLNDIFLRVIGEQHAKWLEQGYEWRFGVETEFIPFLLEEFSKDNAIRQYNPHVEPFYKLRDHFTQASVDVVVSAQQAYRDAKEVIFSNDNLVQSIIEKSMFHSRAELVHELEKYERDLLSDNNDLATKAKLNAFLARLYLLPQDKGGIQDLIDPRFGDYSMGRGWWDDHDVAEVRTPIISDPFEFIEQYHKIIDGIMRAGKDFGVIPSNIPFGRHVHFSVWKDGRNVMKMESEEDFECCTKMGLGLMTRIGIESDLALEIDPGTLLPQEESFEFHRSKVKYGISQRNDNWEYRPLHTNTWPHLAKDIMLMMVGAADGVLDQSSEFDQFNANKKIIADNFALKFEWGIIGADDPNNYQLSKIMGGGYVMPDDTIFGFPDFIDSNKFPELEALLQKVAFDNQIDVVGDVTWDMIYKIVTLEKSPRLSLRNKEWDHPDLNDALKAVSLKSRPYLRSSITQPESLGLLKKSVDFSSRDSDPIFTSEDRIGLERFYQNHYDSLVEGVSQKITDLFVNAASLSEEGDIEKASKQIILRNLLVPLVLQGRTVLYADSHEPIHCVYETLIKQNLEKTVDSLKSRGEGGNYLTSLLEQLSEDIETGIYNFSDYIELFVISHYNSLTNSECEASHLEIDYLSEVEDVSDVFENLLFMHDHYRVQESYTVDEDIEFYNSYTNGLEASKVTLEATIERIRAAGVNDPRDLKALERTHQIFLSALNTGLTFINDHYAETIDPRIDDTIHIKLNPYLGAEL